MAAAIYDIYMEQGASFYKKLTFKDKDGNKLDLTGQSFAGQIRKATGDATTLGTFSFAVLNQITNLGEVEMTMTQLQTAQLPLKPQKTAARTTEKYTYDVERLKVDGTKERVMQGICEVSPEVTV